MIDERRVKEASLSISKTVPLGLPGNLYIYRHDNQISVAHTDSLIRQWIKHTEIEDSIKS
jgi:hypothetical protein